MKQIVSKNGVKGLYVGYGSLVLWEIPFSGIQFPLYEFLKSKTKPKTFLENGLNGSIAGAVAGFLVTPIDVLKTW